MQLTNKKYKQHQYFATYIEESGKPYPLAANKGKSFQGSIVLGKGFLLLPEDAQKLIEKDPRNKDVLFPYLNGDDLNNDPEQKPSRWVINFFDWDEEKAKTYPDCYEIVERLVKPERMKLDADKSSTNKKRKTYWWQYGSDAKSLYNTISGLEQVIAIAQVSKTLAFTFVPNNMVISMMCIVFAYDDFFNFGLLQNSLHHLWVRKYASALKSDTRYTPSDVFETFPFPDVQGLLQVKISKISYDYFKLRQDIMVLANIGLTKLYNLYHDSLLGLENIQWLQNHLRVMDKLNIYDHVVDLIKELRAKQEELDRLIIESYGWTDIEINLGFYKTENENTIIRFDIHPKVKNEILKRLLLLNQARHKAEKGEHLSTNSPKRLRKKDNNNSSNLLF